MTSSADVTPDPGSFILLLEESQVEAETDTCRTAGLRERRGLSEAHIKAAFTLYLLCELIQLQL
jgi:hypothetical protein